MIEHYLFKFINWLVVNLLVPEFRKEKKYLLNLSRNHIGRRGYLLGTPEF
jgi:hypothetical protein